MDGTLPTMGLGSQNSVMSPKMLLPCRDSAIFSYQQHSLKPKVWDAKAEVDSNHMDDCGVSVYFTGLP
jgi:hypothetical protein